MSGAETLDYDSLEKEPEIPEKGIQPLAMPLHPAVAQLIEEVFRSTPNQQKTIKILEYLDANLGRPVPRKELNEWMGEETWNICNTLVRNSEKFYIARYGVCIERVKSVPKEVAFRMTLIEPQSMIESPHSILVEGEIPACVHVAIGRDFSLDQKSQNTRAVLGLLALNAGDKVPASAIKRILLTESTISTIAQMVRKIANIYPEEKAAQNGFFIKTDSIPRLGIKPDPCWTLELVEQGPNREKSQIETRPRNREIPDPIKRALDQEGAPFQKTNAGRLLIFLGENYDRQDITYLEVEQELGMTASSINLALVVLIRNNEKWASYGFKVIKESNPERTRVTHAKVKIRVECGPPFISSRKSKGPQEIPRCHFAGKMTPHQGLTASYEAQRTGDLAGAMAAMERISLEEPFGMSSKDDPYWIEAWDGLKEKIRARVEQLREMIQTGIIPSIAGNWNQRYENLKDVEYGYLNLCPQEQLRIYARQAQDSHDWRAEVLFRMELMERQPESAEMMRLLAHALYRDSHLWDEEALQDQEMIKKRDEILEKMEIVVARQTVMQHPRVEEIALEGEEDFWPQIEGEGKSNAEIPRFWRALFNGAVDKDPGDHIYWKPK